MQQAGTWRIEVIEKCAAVRFKDIPPKHRNILSTVVRNAFGQMPVHAGGGEIDHTPQIHHEVAITIQPKKRPRLEHPHVHEELRLLDQLR